MKKISFLMLIVLVAAVGCKKMDYRKTRSGLLYIIFPGKGNDSLIREGQIVKFHVITKLNDSVLYSSYDRVPGYAKPFTVGEPPYNLLEILTMMRVGDSAVTVQITDTLINKGAQLPPNVKKGDRLTTHIKITGVFDIDSIAQADYNAEMERDRPRQMQEMAKQREAIYDQQDKELEEKGEIGKQLKQMEDFLKSKSINAQKTGKGTFVHIAEQGTGKAAVNGKFIKVKYTGKVIATDSTFESGVYPFQLGMGQAIRGWDEGLLLFKQGGKGTLFIPGFLAYGDNPNSSFRPFEALKFDVELLEVSDNPIAQ